jgi:tetratricopeptide (TPR) repeat protein
MSNQQKARSDPRESAAAEVLPSRPLARTTIDARLLWVVCLTIFVSTIWGVLSARRLVAFADVLAFWQDTLVQQPNDPRVHDNLGVVLIHCGRSREAIEHCQRAVELLPNFADAHSNLAAAYLNLGRPQDAVEHGERAVFIRPDLAEARYNLGTALLTAGRPQDAVEHLKEAVRLRPNLVNAYYNLVVSLFKTDQLTDALVYSEHFVQLKPDDSGAWINLAEVQAKLGRKPAAVASGKRALELARAEGQTDLADQIQRRVAVWSAGD